MSPPKYSHLELERRWLVSLDLVQHLAVERTRWLEDRYIHGTHLRLRVVHEEGLAPVFKLGKKYPFDAEQGQPAVSVYLSEDEHAALAQLPAQTVRKQRHTVAGGALDVYVHPCLAFAIYEMEFNHPTQARHCAAPAFAGREVTGLAEFSGHALAHNTAP